MVLELFDSAAEWEIQSTLDALTTWLDDLDQRKHPMRLASSLRQ